MQRLVPFCFPRRRAVLRGRPAQRAKPRGDRKAQSNVHASRPPIDVPALKILPPGGTQPLRMTGVV